MGLETLPKWGESSSTKMGKTWNPWISSPILLEIQPNNGYENLISKGIKFHSFSSNQTGPKILDEDQFQNCDVLYVQSH